MDTLKIYSRKFEKLRVDRTHGVPAPHKPVLLLSVLQQYMAGQINEPKIYITAELIARFKTNWSHLVKSNHNCVMTYPFYHLKSSGFWQLVPRAGFNDIDKMGSLVKSFTNLNAAVAYVQLPDDLYALMMNPQSNRILQHVLLESFFPGTPKQYLNDTSGIEDLLNDIERKILEEPPSEYKKEINALLKQNDEEEVFLRSSVFKREVPRIYNNTCCISGMRIDTTLNASMIDACHIVPFSLSHDDTITNGIALCPNLHRAFDRGLISVNIDYRVMVSNAFVENKVAYSLKAFDGKEILLPHMNSYYPLKDNFMWHRNNVFEK